jgi:hypothetical protein
VYWSKNTDSHEEIIKEFDLHADGAKGPNITRVEIVPPGENYLLPLDQWEFRKDQDILPDWYDAKKAEKAVRKILPEWLAANVILPGVKVDALNKYVAVCYGEVGEMWESAKVGEMRGSANVGVMRESANVGEMWGSANVGEMRGSANVETVNDLSIIRVFSDKAKCGKLIGPNALILDYTGKVVNVIRGKK